MRHFWTFSRHSSQGGGPSPPTLQSAHTGSLVAPNKNEGNMAGRLNGKVALVTGGSSGIGLAAAKRFVAEGATAYITGRRQETLDTAAASIGGTVTAVRADSGVVTDLERLYATIRAKSGKLDVLFANARIAEFLPLQAIQRSITTASSTRT
jgi:NAD(P)-dependent dehydrogenase (short-subunit alcohol dehydrogenase family)